MNYPGFSSPKTTTAKPVPSDRSVRTSDELLVNLFSITNLSNVVCSYKIWEVTGLPIDSSSFEENRQTLRFKVSSSIHGPAEIIKEADSVLLVIPDGYKEPELSYSLAPFVANLKPTTRTGSVNFSLNDENSLLLGKRFLQSVISNKLKANSESLWQPKAGRPFYSKVPSNAADTSSEIDVFEGFSFRVIFVSGVGYCVLIDSTTRFVLREPLPAKIAFEDRWKYLRKEQNSKSGKQMSTHYVYRFGHSWYEIMLQSILKESAGEKQFVHPDTQQPISVYDYTIEKWQQALPEWCRQLDKDWTAIEYVNWRGGRINHGFAKLCYPVVKTEELSRRSSGALQRYAVKRPDQRLQLINNYAKKWLRDIKLGDQPIKVSHEPLSVDRRFFQIPDLEFGKKTILHSPSGQELRHYPKRRMELLQDSASGFWNAAPLQEQWALIPRDIKTTVWPPFKENLWKEMKRFCGQEFQYNPHAISYTDFGDSLASQVKAIMQALENEQKRQGVRPSGYCLAVLPDNAHPQLPAYLTSTLSQSEPKLHVACIHLSSFQQAFVSLGGGSDRKWFLKENRDDLGKIKGYLRNVAIKVLLLNNRWPFVISDENTSLSKVLFIGLDVLNPVAGFTFLGNGGRICFFVSVDSEDEKLSTRKVKKIISDNIREIPKAYNGWIPELVILVRDGRLFDTELKGFKQALSEVNISRASAVEIPKVSALAVRFFLKRNESGDNYRIHNARIGAYFQVNNSEISICTTGFPFTIHGTSMPLTVRKVWGDTSIDKLGEYIYDLAQLAWTAPDRPSRYPLVIRYTDMRLEAIASVFDEEETEYGDDQIDEDESETDDV